MELRQYWAIVRRRKWVVLVILAAALAGAWKATGLEPSQPRYRATATLLVTTAPGTPVVPYPVDTIRTLSVAREAASRAQVDDDPARVLDSLSIAPRQGTSLIDVQVEHRDPAAAARLANAFAQLYLARFASATAADPRALAALRRMHEGLREQAVRLARSPLDPIRREWELRWLQAQGDSIDQAYADMLMRGLPGSSEARLAEPAAPPTRPVETPLRRRAQVLGGIGLVALLGALALVFLLEYVDVRLRTEDDVSKATGLPVVAALPSPRRLRRVARRFTAAARRYERDGSLAGPGASLLPDPRLAEAFQTLRVRVEFATRGRRDGHGGGISILVASPWGGREKTWVAAYLAAVFAQAGRRVVLVSADLHDDSLEQLFRVDLAPGLSEAATDDSLDLRALLQQTWVPNLQVVPAGLAPGQPAEALASAGVERVFEAARAAADLVVVEGPPVLAGAGTAVLASRSDGLLLVFQGGRTTRAQALAAKTALEKVRNGAELLGAVLTNVAEVRAVRRYTRRRPQRGLLGRRGGRRRRTERPSGEGARLEEIRL